MKDFYFILWRSWSKYVRLNRPGSNSSVDSKKHNASTIFEANQTLLWDFCQTYTENTQFHHDLADSGLIDEHLPAYVDKCFDKLCNTRLQNANHFTTHKRLQECENNEGKCRCWSYSTWFRSVLHCSEYCYSTCRENFVLFLGSSYLASYSTWKKSYFTLTGSPSARLLAYPYSICVCRSRSANSLSWLSDLIKPRTVGGGCCNFIHQNNYIRIYEAH